MKLELSKEKLMSFFEVEMYLDKNLIELIGEFPNTPPKLKIMLYFGNYLNVNKKSNDCFISTTGLASLLGLQREQCQKAISSLIAEGIIHRTGLPRSKGRTKGKKRCWHKGSVDDCNICNKDLASMLKPNPVYKTKEYPVDKIFLQLGNIGTISARTLSLNYIKKRGISCNNEISSNDIIHLKAIWEDILSLNGIEYNEDVPDRAKRKLKDSKKKFKIKDLVMAFYNHLIDKKIFVSNQRFSYLQTHDFFLSSPIENMIQNDIKLGEYVDESTIGM